MEDTHVHALDYLSVFRRRKWWLVVPIVASIAVGALLVRYLPKQYRSSATVAVAASGVSTSLVGQSAPLDNEERLRAVSQQLLSGPTLARVAREEKLSAPGSEEAVITRLRSAVTITVPEPVATTNEPRHLDSFIVSYADADPGRTQRVANRLADVFVDESSKTREQRAEHTSAFIASQLAASQSRLAELEGRLRRAKESHIGQLPEQTQANLQTLSGLRQQIDANATSLRGEQDRLSMIERQLEGMKQGAADVFLAPRATTGSSEAAASPEARVLALQRELGAARLAYTDKHPEVIRLQDELATARKEAAAEHQRPASDRVAQLQLDPAYRQLNADRETARIRIRELLRAEEGMRRQIGVYQSRVESAPMVEQQLASVQRDFDLERQQYADLSAKLRAASMAESVERNRRGEQFTVLYSAAYPSEPIKPVPLRVMLLSLVVGVCLGAGLTLGREYLDRSVHNVRELRDELDLPVLGEIVRIQPV
jgi:polysaccharide chain length determinant protein (PEP-CTERM system associated)